MSPARPLRVATRGSRLARAQADLVASALGGDAETVVVETTGDRERQAEIWQLGGKGVFVKEVQAAVLDGRADLAVHSAKDLPSTRVRGLVLAAVPRRADPRDVLVGSTFEGLPVGGLVATGSVRRRAQLAWLRPDLTFSGLRGNVDTRLGKAARFDAVVVAAAALERLGRSPEGSQPLDPDLVIPQVGQGALAVECRDDDDALLERLAEVDHGPSRRAVEAERAFLARIGGGCDLPVGAYATTSADGEVRLHALLAAADGHLVLRHRDEHDDPVALGERVADHLLEHGGHLLLENLVAP